VEGIERTTHYKVEDITRMLAMCWDLDRVKQYLLAPSIQDFTSGFQLDIYGFGQKPYPNSELPNVTFHPTADRLKRHFTAIELKGRPTLGWYEPDHDLTDDQECRFLGFVFKRRGTPNDGAFLLEFDPEPEKIKRFYDHFRHLEQEAQNSTFSQ
jgi:hypothetical protein